MVHFGPLPDGAMESIARKYLKQLQSRTQSQGIGLTLPAELATHLGSMGRDKGGARSLRRLVQEQVEGPLAAFLLGLPGKPERITGRLEQGKLCFANE